MTLAELSAGYIAAGDLVRHKIGLLRQQLRACDNAAQRAQLRQRINALGKILTQLNDLAELTAKYYERGFYRNEAYTL